MWVMIEKTGDLGSWYEVGYFILDWDTIDDGGKVIQKSVFRSIYTGLSRGEAADKVHYLNGGRKE